MTEYPAKVDQETYANMSEADRTAYDASMRKKEEEEQARLPYKWKQTLGDVDVFVPVPKGTKAKMLDVKIDKLHLRVGFKGQPPIVDVKMMYSWYQDKCLVGSVERADQGGGQYLVDR